MILIPLGVAAILIARRKNFVDSGQCRTCGYDLTGNVSGVCPECGTAACGTSAQAVASPPAAPIINPQ
jgi:hypothetical protein